jgi:dolichol-phosphate mannosyltransferase
MRRPAAWQQLARFCLVGGSGYGVNLAVFALANNAGATHRTAASAAFLVAVCNNYLWNRLWTFDAGSGRAGIQAMRFMLVSVLTFLCSLAVLELLVTRFGRTGITAQAISIAVTTPLSFLGNRLWTFRPVV